MFHLFKCTNDYLFKAGFPLILIHNFNYEIFVRIRALNYLIQHYDISFCFIKEIHI
jgi:hypothetical protein